jgi:37-kD nucleoid-associated bacterial protein
MSVKIRFTSAFVTDLVLAKVGNPSRQEPLETSKRVFKVAEEDQPALTGFFLKPFKNLTGHRFSHHSSLDQHEMNGYAKAILSSEDGLLEKGCEIARLLYAKSNHPNIKSGDLCISLVRDIEVEGEMKTAICILKSESVVPFLSITTKNGDLELSTEHGINPEKIDKGCLILNYHENKGYYVLTFDRAGAESRFWVRDFLGVVPVTDGSFLTNKYAELAVKFLEDQKKAKPVTAAEVDDETPPWESNAAARDAIAYFEEKEEFSLPEFEQEVLKEPEMVAAFAEHRRKIEEEQGEKLQDKFEISKKEINKAKRRVAPVMKLDTGVEIRLKPSVASKPERVLEHGYDEERRMKFIKVFFNEDLGG